MVNPGDRGRLVSGGTSDDRPLVGCAAVRCSAGEAVCQSVAAVAVAPLYKKYCFVFWHLNGVNHASSNTAGQDN